MTTDTIIAAFEERFCIPLDPSCRKECCIGDFDYYISSNSSPESIKAWLKSSLQSYRNAVLDEAMGLVEDIPRGHGASLSELIFNANNSLWRMKLEALKSEDKGEE